MCALDVMGYAAEQFYTVPFLVYAKAIQKYFSKGEKLEDLSEIDRRVFNQIEETCLQIVL